MVEKCIKEVRKYLEYQLKTLTWLPLSSLGISQRSWHVLKPRSRADGKKSHGTISPHGLQHDSYGNRWWLQYSLSLSPANNTHKYTHTHTDICRGECQPVSGQLGHQTCLTVWDCSPVLYLISRSDLGLSFTVRALAHPSIFNFLIGLTAG